MLPTRIDVPELLRGHVRAHIAANDDDLAALAAVLVPRTVRRLEVISRQGEVARHLHFVQQGCLRCYATDVRGVDHVLRFAVEGWWLSDFHSFFTGESSAYTLDALEDSHVLVMTRAAQERLCDERPVFCRYFRCMLERLTIATHRRLLGMMAGSAEARYDDFLRSYPAIAQRLPLHQVASYLGITPEALSRVRARLVRRPG